MAERIGERFARAIASKDSAGLKELMQPDIDFRAMTPAKFWEATNPTAIVDETMLGRWFSPERRIVEVLAVDTDTVGSRERVGYRFRVARPDGEFVIEQQAYFETDGKTISWLRILCSGFVPVS
jgi:hypothetical protein